MSEDLSYGSRGVPVTVAENAFYHLGKHWRTASQVLDLAGADLELWVYQETSQVMLRHLRAIGEQRAKYWTQRGIDARAVKPKPVTRERRPHRG